MTTSTDSLLGLGMQITHSIANELTSHSDELSKEIHDKTSGSDKVKTGDKLGDETARDIAKQFIDDENLEKVLVKDAGDIAEDHVSETENKKLVFISEDFGVKEFGNPDAEDGIFIIADCFHGSGHVRPWNIPKPCVYSAVALGNLRRIHKHPDLSAVQVGIVRDIFHGDTYYAMRGRGSFFEGSGKIHTSPRTEFDDSMFAIDLTMTGDEFDNLLDRLRNILRDVKVKRRVLNIPDVCKVACGEYEANISLTGCMLCTDIAAIKIITEEAGGIFEEKVHGDLKNEDLVKNFLKYVVFDKKHNLTENTSFEFIVSANKTLHKKITEKIPSWV